MTDVSEIDRITEHIRSVMIAYVAHRELLDPAVLPLQDAIVEKTLLDGGLPDVLNKTQLALQQQDLSPEVISALNRLELVCRMATTAITSGGAPIQ